MISSFYHYSFALHCDCLSNSLLVASPLHCFRFLDLLPLPAGCLLLPEGCVPLPVGCNPFPDGYVSPISVFICLKSSLGQDCELLVLWSDQTCPGFHHQVQYVAGFLLPLGALLNALAQGRCLVHWKIPIMATTLHLSSLFYHRYFYIPLKLLDLISLHCSSDLK